MSDFDFLFNPVIKQICLLCGPIALIISIITYNKVREKLEGQKEIKPQPQAKSEPISIQPPPVQRTPEPPPIPIIVPQIQTLPPPLPPELVPPKPVHIEQPETFETAEKDYETYQQQTKQQAKEEIGAWEQKIGTRWILIAGLITVFAGVGFFLKFAYEKFSIGPTGRVLAVTIFGLIALLAGEITRRRNYDIVAKGVTALGFAILYAAVFSAYHIYNLIGYIPACFAASVITIAAMIYAVGLDEVLIAFLSLFGGFATPMIVLTKITHPAPLFVYALILGAGAMVCAYYRRWRAVNLLSFIGTFILYSLWFYNSQFYNVSVKGGAFIPSEIFFVLGWLAAFFVIYSLMPILYGLSNKVKARTEDLCLVLADAAITLYYLSVVLFEWFRDYLALAAVLMAAVYLILSAVVYRRCREDVNLRVSLHAIGIFCATLAIPLYFKLNTTTVTWALEAAVLVYIGLRYGSLLTQAAGIIVTGLSVGCLLMTLPMHAKAFPFILNQKFGQWVFVSVAVFASHLFFRRNKTQQVNEILTQLFYGLSMILLFAACSMEWYYHCQYNSHSLKAESGQLLIFSAFIIMFLPKFIRPSGILSEVLSWILIAAGAIVCCADARITSHPNPAFWNIDFACMMIFLATILVSQIIYRKISNIISQVVYVLFGLLLLISLSLQWSYYCGYNLPDDKLIRGFIMIYAAGILLFVIRPIAPKGVLPQIVAFILAICGSFYRIAEFNRLRVFTIFFNIDFLITFLFILALFTAAWFVARNKEPNSELFKAAFSIIAIIVLWVMLTQEIYYYWQNKTVIDTQLQNWQFIAQMCISIAWAIYGLVLMIIGFWRKVSYLRYMSFGLFALLLAKVFLVDTQEIKSIYRVAAFLVTGITLVGVSYLYQYLKNQGFFQSFIKDNDGIAKQ